MNERIKQIAEQAGFDVKRLLEPYPGGFPREDFLALESFAELIVKECAERLLNDAKLTDIQTTRCVASIREHFGIEE